MQRRKEPIDATSLGIVLHACDHANDELAWRIFQKYKDEPASSVPPAPATGEGEGEGYERSPLQFSHGALMGSPEASSPFNLLHYTHMVSALNRTTFAHYVPLILSHLHSHRVRPDLYFYTRVLSVLASQRLYREQMQVMREMPAYGVQPDEKCYYLVVRCHGECGRWKAAMQVIEEMRDRRLRINEFIYEAAVIACEKAVGWRQQRR